MKSVAAIALLLMFALPSFAEVNLVVSNGVLLGAQHVKVNGNLYTVMFVDGSCIQLFSNCSSTRFAFHDLKTAMDAGQVLIDQILIDGPSGQFHSHPALVGGCEGAETPGFERQCAILTPFGFDVQQGLFSGSSAVNGSTGSYIYTQTPVQLNPYSNYMGLPVTFAVWEQESPIPATSMDFDGNGRADILLRTDNGDLSMGLMNVSGKISDISLGNIPMEWKIAGSGDFNGDGKADILWRNMSGEVAIWFMNGAQVQDWTSLGKVGLDLTISGIRDFDADGKADILWQDGGGTLAVWMMNSASITQSTILGTMPGRRVQP